MWLCLLIPAWSGGLLHHLHWLLFLLALFLLSVSGILLREMRRDDYNDSRTMKSAREWRAQLLASVYKSSQSPKSEEPLLPRSPVSEERKTMPWDVIWLRALTRFRMLSRTIAERWTRKGRASTTSGLAQYKPIVFCAACGLCLLAFTRSQQYPVEIHHRVSVWSAVPGTTDEWMLSSEEPEPYALPYGRWKCCPDFDCRAVIAPGYIADTLKYEAHGTCNSIRASGLGFFWQPRGQTGWALIAGGGK